MKRYKRIIRSDDEMIWIIRKTQKRHGPRNGKRADRVEQNDFPGERGRGGEGAARYLYIYNIFFLTIASYRDMSSTLVSPFL